MKNSADFGYLTSTDNWPEFLDPPPNASVIRAEGNQIVRLAPAAVQNRGDSFIISVDQICYMRAKEVADFLGMDSENVLFLCWTLALLDRYRFETLNGKTWHSSLIYLR